MYPPLKRRKISHMTNNIQCCSCQEENVPYLLLVGCSNRHVMCHLCTRMFVSSKIVMNKFPRYFPGKINTREDMECPLCRESLNGLTNMFVFCEEDEKKNQVAVSSPSSAAASSSSSSRCKFDCPYKELLGRDTAKAIGCHKKMSLDGLHKHLIKTHNQTVKCPNCSTWLCDGEKNMEDLLQFHIMKNCQQVKCQGCDRRGNMLTMYMHSIIGRDSVCDSARSMFSDFGSMLSECFYVFDRSENMTQLSTMMLRWIVQYLYQRQNGEELGVDVYGKHFHRIFYAFLFRVFCKIHAPLAEKDTDSLLEQILELANGSDRNTYEENVMLLTSAYARKHNLRMDRVSELPFLYRLLIMALSDFQHAQKLAKRYPKTTTPTENSDIHKLVEVYQQCLPEETDIPISFQLQGQPSFMGNLGTVPLRSLFPSAHRIVFRQ